MANWRGVKDLKAIKDYFDTRFEQTCQIVAESQTETQFLTQLNVFLISLQQRMIQVNPEMKDLLGEDELFQRF